MLAHCPFSYRLRGDRRSKSHSGANGEEAAIVPTDANVDSPFAARMPGYYFRVLWQITGSSNLSRKIRKTHRLSKCKAGPERCQPGRRIRRPRTSYRPRPASTCLASVEAAASRRPCRSWVWLQPPRRSRRSELIEPVASTTLGSWMTSRTGDVRLQAREQLRKGRRESSF